MADPFDAPAKPNPWTQIRRIGSLSAALFWFLQIALGDMKALGWFGAATCGCWLWLEILALPAVKRWIRAHQFPMTKTIGCSGVVTLCLLMGWREDKKETARAAEIKKQSRMLTEDHEAIQDVQRRIIELRPGVRNQLPSSSDETGKSVRLEAGRVSIDMTLVSSSAEEWTFALNRVVVEPNLHVDGDRVTVKPGSPFAVITGDDASLLVDVMTLPNGHHVPWVGLVPPVVQSKVHSLWRFKGLKLIGG
jgi:hypothetical protein